LLLTDFSVVKMFVLSSKNVILTKI